MLRTRLIIVVLGVACWFSLADAQYVLILKNGRQITVQSYREEGASIKFSGLGGEIAIAKDQIQAIEKAGQSNRPGLSLPELEASSRQSPSVPQKSTPTPTRDVIQPPSPSKPTPAAAEEEKEYQKKLAEVTAKLEAAKEKYFNATQGGGTATNVSKDGMSSWVMDFASRIHDSQKVAGGGGASSTPPTPPYAPTYTSKEKELSDLRIQIDSLQKERNSLIEEMNSKNIPTGAL